MLEKASPGPSLVAALAPEQAILSPRSLLLAEAAGEETKMDESEPPSGLPGALAPAGAASAPVASYAQVARAPAQFTRHAANPVPQGLSTIIDDIKKQMADMQSRQDFLEARQAESSSRLEVRMDSNHAQLIAMLQQMAMSGAQAAAATAAPPS